MNYSPLTSAIEAFHPKTATGKLNAVMTPIGPRGFHCSSRKCPGRSEGNTDPARDLDSPTA